MKCLQLNILKENKRKFAKLEQCLSYAELYGQLPEEQLVELRKIQQTILNHKLNAIKQIKEIENEKI